MKHALWALLALPLVAFGQSTTGGNAYVPNGGTPGGSAGGDLGGTYPNPTVLQLTHATGDLGSGVLSSSGQILLDATNSVSVNLTRCPVRRSLVRLALGTRLALPVLSIFT
jgi:hypothetical protein